jgi:hypothetical protein
LKYAKRGYGFRRKPAARGEPPRSIARKAAKFELGVVLPESEPHPLFQRVKIDGLSEFSNARIGKTPAFAKKKQIYHERIRQLRFRQCR